MAAIKKSSHGVGFDVGLRAFMYIVPMEHLDWDLAFLGKELSAHVVA